MFERSRIKFGEIVSHDQPYLDPISGKSLPRDFYDRREISEAAYQKLLGDEPCAVILLGGRRAGKTSQIRHLRARLADTGAGPIGFIEIPWGGIRTHIELAREILLSLRAYVGRELALRESLEQAPLVEPATPDAFLAAVSSLLELTAGRRIILAIDEFDSILVESIQATGHRGEAERIGDLVHALVGGAFPSLRLLLSMAAIPEAVGGEDLARFFDHSFVTRLNCFPKADMDDMVQDIIQQDQPIARDDLEAIFQLAGGWPYYAKLLLECMADLPPTPDQVQRAVQAAVHHHGAGQTIANIYDLHFDEAQKQLVLLLALRGGQLDAAEWATASPALQSAAHQLASKDIVDVVADGGCRFRIGLLAAWFRGWSRYELELERRLGDFPFDGNALNT